MPSRFVSKLERKARNLLADVGVDQIAVEPGRSAVHARRKLSEEELAACGGVGYTACAAKQKERLAR